MVSNLLDFTVPGMAEEAPNTSNRDEKEMGRPLLHILRKLYDSDALRPVPYDPDKAVSQYRVHAMKDGRPDEIIKLCATWWSSVLPEIQTSDLDAKVEELLWANTLWYRQARSQAPIGLCPYACTECDAIPAVFAEDPSQEKFQNYIAQGVPTGYDDVCTRPRSPQD